MKRCAFFLLLLGFFISISTQALAADVKFSGKFIAGGMYLDKTSLKKDISSDGPSTLMAEQAMIFLCRQNSD